VVKSCVTGLVLYKEEQKHDILSLKRNWMKKSPKQSLSLLQPYKTTVSYFSGGIIMTTIDKNGAPPNIAMKSRLNFKYLKKKKS
jgi:hypothetical protein